MGNFTLLLSILKGLGSALMKGFLALFLLNSGTNKEVLKGSKKDVKDAKKAGKRKNHLNTLSNAALRNGLRRKPKK